jgi:AcrR family transcriptional regulator
MSVAVVGTIVDMVRWEPGAKERLQLAAVALFLARGFDQTTVQEIAQEAGLTERTFFRHFADKREVLFQGQQQYVAAFVRGIREAPDGTSPFGLIRAALDGASGFFDDEHRPWSRQRQAVIDANPPLQERESLKRVSLADALTAALVERGVGGTDARLTAEIGVSAFFVAFRTWIDADEHRSLDELQQEALARVAAIVPAPAPAV